MNMITKGLCVPLVLVAMVSCGGGGSDVAGGGIGGTGISQGPITGFGSVIVNGITFDDSSAAIKVENVPNRLRTDLKVGMVVKIEWEKDAGGRYIAKSIIYSDDVQGPVGGIVVDVTGDAAFTVLGQRVMTHPATTVFDGVADAAELVNGNIVEISGLKDAADVIHATRVEFKSAVAGAGETFELNCHVGGLDTVAKTFALDAVTVNYGALAVPTEGVCVEVKSTAGIVNGQLVASSIEVDDDCKLGGSEGQEIEVKGFPSVINKTANTFTVSGRLVSYTDAAFESGSSEAVLSGAAIVEVEGALKNGVLVAKKISVELEGDLEGKGIVLGAVAANGTLTVNLSEPVLGPKTFTVNNLTIYEDDNAVPISNFGKANITAGQILKVRYYVDGTSNVAMRIKRE